MNDLHNRRMFLRAAAAAGAAWAAVDLLQVEEALAWTAQHPAHGNRPAAAIVRVLTQEQAATLDAMSARILPAVDGRAGAHEAGVVYFIDRSLATFNASQKTFYADGVTDLNRRAAEKGQAATAAGFATLTSAQQDAVLHDIEETPFFQAVRFDTIVGTFGLPTLGGNRDYVGWRMLGLEHQPAFQAPFGFYDADVNRKG